MAARRLMRDAREILESPLRYVGAAPLEDNLFVWHVNLSAETAPLNEACFHLILRFPTDYPAHPPRVVVCTPIPHSNVFASKPSFRDEGYEVCLDMLETKNFADANLAQRPYTGWSTSYSVRSLMMQLQAFLFDEKLQSAVANGTQALSNALKAAKRFSCVTCPHSPSAPSPPLPTDDDLHRIRKVVVSRPVRPSRLSASPPTSAAAFKTKRAVVSAGTLQGVKETALTVPINTAGAKDELKGSVSVKATGEALKSVALPICNYWEALNSADEMKEGAKNEEGKKGKKGKKGGNVKNTESPGSVDNSKALDTKAEAVGTTGSTVANGTSPGMKEGKVGPAQVGGGNVAAVGIVGGKQGKGLGAAARKNQKRTEKRRQKREMEQGQGQGLSKEKEHSLVGAKEGEGGNAGGDRAEEAVGLAQGQDTGFGEKDGTDSTASDVTVRTATGSWGEATEVGTSVAAVESMGSFAALPHDVLLLIVSRLSSTDIGRLTQTCRAFRGVCDDGYLWKEVFSRTYPASQLSAAALADWKHVFMLELNQAVDEMVCFYTKASYKEDVLGIPLEFTVNPKTQRVDYIYSSMDWLSYTAFTEHKVRSTVWKEKFSLFLPLYIDEEHYQRALPTICRTIRKLCPDWRTDKFVPEMALDVIPNLMNTLVVLVSDKGVHASERALDGYCRLWRLLVALMTTYPCLHKSVHTRLSSFLSSEQYRHKDLIPALGHLIPLLSVCPSFPWPKAGPTIVSESLDRKALWVCKADPRLADLSDASVTDTDRVRISLEATKVSRRLMAFQVYFLWLLRGRSIGETACDLDHLYGKMPRSATVAFQAHVRRIVDNSRDSWPEYFALVRLKVPSFAALAEMLRQSIRNSRRKGYHSATTNFAAIQASGVSKILLKGETYSAPPTLAKVQVEESWQWNDGTGVKYLDATCLIYSFKGDMVGYVDYSNEIYKNGCVVHSGDVLDYDKREGKHTINIHLGGLPAVKAFVFTVSAFHCSFEDIVQPYVRLCDAATDAELCTYNFEKISSTGVNTAIVMCCLSRKTVSSPWQLVAVGDLCQGCAGVYEPIKERIRQLKLF